MKMKFVSSPAFYSKFPFQAYKHSHASPNYLTSSDERVQLGGLEQRRYTQVSLVALRHHTLFE